jgi:hypothetical protein
MLLSFDRQKKVTKENSRLDPSLTQHQLCRYAKKTRRYLFLFGISTATSSTRSLLRLPGWAHTVFSMAATFAGWVPTCGALGRILNLGRSYLTAK